MNEAIRKECHTELNEGVREITDSGSVGRTTLVEGQRPRRQRGDSGGDNGEGTDGENGDNDRRLEWPITYQTRNPVAVEARNNNGTLERDETSAMRKHQRRWMPQTP